MINIYQAPARARDQRTAFSAREALAVLRDDARIVEVKRDMKRYMCCVRIRNYTRKPGTNPESRRILCGNMDFWR